MNNRLGFVLLFIFGSLTIFVAICTLIICGFMLLLGYPYSHDPLSAWCQWATGIGITAVIGGHITVGLGFLTSVVMPTNKWLNGEA